MNYTHGYSSPLGGITMASDGQSLTGLWFDGQRYYADTLQEPFREGPLPIFDEADRWLDLYFSGKVPDFTPKLRLQGTAFRKLVWEVLLTIAYGQVVTYGDLAEEIARRTGRVSMAPRAVGGAVAHNPLSLIIPCHRVVGAGGSLTGYAGGIERKRRLLTLEGVDLSAFPK